MKCLGVLKQCLIGICGVACLIGRLQVVMSKPIPCKSSLYLRYRASHTWGTELIFLFIFITSPPADLCWLHWLWCFFAGEGTYHACAWKQLATAPPAYAEPPVIKLGADLCLLSETMVLFRHCLGHLQTSFTSSRATRLVDLGLVEVSTWPASSAYADEAALYRPTVAIFVIIWRP